MKTQEIIKAAQAYYHSGILHEAAKVSGFVRGANWANKTILDRACEWLNKILYIHTEIEEDKGWGETNSTNWVTSDYDTVGEFITAFRQAMEGGAE